MTSDNPAAPRDRLALLKPGTLAEAQRGLHERIMAEKIPWAEKAKFQAAMPDGRLLGPFNALPYDPAVGQAYLDLFSADRKATSRSKRTHEIVVLTVGAA